jgi:hypothetical protein
MPFLLVDVAFHRCDGRWTYADRSIAVLPSEHPIGTTQACRRVSFELAHDVGQGPGFRHLQKEMHMIFRTADCKQVNLRIVRDGAQYSPGLCRVINRLPLCGSHFRFA